ncbi:GntR family transcriptional regulator [Burkholderiaceae bacterium FT117]|uniref:GntR family transcriptional regulator n=1 Tax=Zeimonas sediminis TaxID=2944268 RepID=UPI002343219D|nr:GntR family transcriptional regulator [Zeimonas sediminis]MCM5572135.1 GntR family transcriptional regulator [Zeimonas sediminis]
MIRPLVPEPDLVDKAHASLLEAILSGELEPGRRYTQEALAERLGVSRQPVIQALRLLRMQGLIVDTANRRGVEVAPLDEAFVGWLYELRAALDAAAARAAARAPRPELRAEGAAILREGRAAAAAGDLEALVRADLRFHLFVYEAAGNPLLLETARQHWHHTRRAMSAYVRRAGPMRKVWAEHAAILEAIVAGDAERAARLSHDHAANSVRQLLAAPREGPAEAEAGRSTRLGRPAA